MLRINVPPIELFDEKTDEFKIINETTLELEHSLISMSKWEARWSKPFLEKNDRTNEETIDYIRDMTITRNVDPNIFINLPGEIVEQISDYIAAPMTATTFSDGNKPHVGVAPIVTAELVYYWMIALNIPFECQKWHLNRLLTLVRVCNEKNSPPKKMSRTDLIARNKQLNAQRKAALRTTG